MGSERNIDRMLRIMGVLEFGLVAILCIAAVFLAALFLL